MITYIPFCPSIRVSEESVVKELSEEIEKMAKEYGKDVHDFSAKFELVPIPDEKGHFLVSEVCYLKGTLK